MSGLIYEIHVDGACVPNPGRGGIGFIIYGPDR